MGDQKTRLKLRLSGEHNLKNALLAIAVGLELGIDLEAAAAALAAVEAPSMRGEIRVLPDGTRVILDCYNANPQSMAASLAAFGRRSPRGVAILGDMLELGAGAASAHAAIGRAVAQASADLALIAVGRYAELVADAARQAGLSYAVAVADAEAAAEALRDRQLDGRPILLKGSRGMRLERVYAALTNREGR
ncbi:MAG: cyanophycin synthetase [bacterium]